MRAMVLKEVKKPLTLEDLPRPTPGDHDVLIQVEACGVCRTDLHIVDGELCFPKLPLILGHQIVGTVIEKGMHANIEIGTKVGVPWLGKTCGTCLYCANDQENLCDNALYTGYQRNGGFAEFCVADARFVFPLPSEIVSVEVAPLLCGGLIGYRAIRMTADALRVGFYGFGSSAHLLIQLLTYQNREVYAFTKDGDEKGQAFAKSLGAVWAGGSSDSPPNPLDAAIIFAPVGSLVLIALKAIRKGGVVICAGIHMSDIPSFPYHLLWEERILRSVANLTRQDGREFLDIALKIPIHSQITTYSLEEANQALNDLRDGCIKGSAVILL